MRLLFRLILLSLILLLTACGSEEVMTPPAFSDIKVNDLPVSTTPFKDPSVTITGTISDFAAKVVANSTATGEKPVPVVPVINSTDGTWSFVFAPLTEGANTISFTASDQRGNINQLFLTVYHDLTAPSVTSVTQVINLLPLTPQLVVTYNEALLDTSLTTAIFAVVNADDTPLIGPPLTATLTLNTVTLTLDAPLEPGFYKLTGSGVTDLAGNSVTVTAFPFEIPILSP